MTRRHSSTLYRPNVCRCWRWVPCMLVRRPPPLPCSKHCSQCQMALPDRQWSSIARANVSVANPTLIDPRISTVGLQQLLPGAFPLFDNVWRVSRVWFTGDQKLLELLQTCRNNDNKSFIHSSRQTCRSQTRQHRSLPRQGWDWGSVHWRSSPLFRLHWHSKACVLVKSRGNTFHGARWVDHHYDVYQAAVPNSRSSATRSAATMQP
jgi:hypothetical protein